MRSLLRSSTRVLVALGSYWTYSSLHADPPRAAEVEVTVGGAVAHPGKYQLKSPALIDRAFALAGGWKNHDKEDPDLIPSPKRIIRHRGRESVGFRVSTDAKGRISTRDEIGRRYHLASGDILVMGVAAW